MFSEGKFSEEEVLYRTQQLRDACRFHQRAEFREAIANGADINGIAGVVNPPLVAAIESSNKWAIYELLKYPAIDVNRYDIDRFTPLFSAVMMGDEEIVNALLARGADPKAFCGYPLLTAAISNLSSYACLQYGIWSREKKYDMRTGAPHPWIETPEDKLLKQEALDYYHQRGKYAKQAITDQIRFDNTGKDPIIVYFRGKLEIVDVLLNAGPSLLPVAGTDVTPEALVKDPGKYKRYFSAFPEEKLKSYRSSVPTILEFGMQFRDKFCQDDDNFIEISVSYDIQPVRKRVLDYLQRYSSPKEGADLLALAKKVEDEVHERHQQFRADMDSRLATVQRRLSDVQSKQNVLSDLFQSELEDRQAVARFKAHPNLLAFYRRFYIQLEATFISFKAVSGGQVVGKSGDFAVAKSIFEFCSDSVSITPIVGPAAEKFLKWTVGAALDAADDARQGNTANNISRLVTVNEAGKCAEAIARALTQMYDWQLRQLATIEQAQARQNALQANTQKVKKSLLREQFIAPAEHLAVFAVAWVMDALYNIHTKTVNGQADLVQILLTEITQREPSGKLLRFWGAVTAQLGWGALPTQTGDLWTPEDLLTRSGIQTPEGYFVGEKTDYQRFGWRLGTADDVKALGLAPYMPEMQRVVAPEAQWMLGGGAAPVPVSYGTRAPANGFVGAPPPSPVLVPGFAAYRENPRNAPNVVPAPVYPASPVLGEVKGKANPKKCAVM